MILHRSLLPTTSSFCSDKTGPELPHAHPVVDGGADDADAGADDGADDRPVLRLLSLRTLLLVRVTHRVRQLQKGTDIHYFHHCFILEKDTRYTGYRI